MVTFLIAAPAWSGEKDGEKGEKSMAKKILVIGVAAALILLSGGIASAGATPAEKCQSGKNKAAGKYAACRQNAEAKLITTGDTGKYNDTIGKCATKLADKWGKLEATAAKKNVSCPDTPLTEANFKKVIDEHSDNITAGLNGGGLVWCGNGVKDGSESCDGSDLGGKTCTSFGFASGTLACTASCGFNTTGCNPIVCGNGTIDPGEQCDQDNLNGQTCVGLSFAFGTLTCGPNCQFNTSGCFSPPILVDNGNGTITDKQTGLMWEKKAAFNNAPVICTSPALCPDPHDADNVYTWTDANTPTSNPTGTAFTVFLAQLNSGGGFAGHTDWRLPTLDELEGIVDYAKPTSPVVNAVFDTGCSGSCTVTTCSCTAPGRTWSGSSEAINTLNAWFVDFSSGDVGHDTKDTDYSVRAVRP